MEFDIRAEESSTCCACDGPVRVLVHQNGLATFEPCPTCQAISDLGLGGNPDGEYRLIETGPAGATYSAPRWYPKS